MGDQAVFESPHELDFPYSRSLGPTLSAFMTGLRDGQITGTRGDGGRVIVPPTEYDPISSAPTEGSVNVGPGGVLTSWTWIDKPKPSHPSDKPFAWAMVKLDGADTAMLHILKAPSADGIASGMRVSAQFRPEAERVGCMADIAAFIPEEGS
ncbi:MAG: OB-fold domain-containing protein [Actinomycetota bacterium]|jgi:uncharacterized OB-fold protein